MISPAATKLAAALRAAAKAHAREDGPGRYRATITRWQGEDDFVCDLHGSDVTLDEHDITLGRTVRRAIAEDGIAVDDALILVELGEGDYAAVDIESDEDI